MSESLLELKNITKRFPGVLALDKVGFDLKAGEVHVLFGENGAGKSTLIKIIAGSYLPDEGEIWLDGKRRQIRDPQHARQLGISAVYQEFSLVPQLTVAENLFLGKERTRGGMLLDKAGMMEAAAEELAELEFNLDPMAKVEKLTRAQKQMVEIAKALLDRMKVLILDEPTASVTDKEVAHLFKVIQRLKAEGRGIIYISHRIEEFKQIGDRITVLRDGRFIKTLPMAEADEDKLIPLMTGREFQDVFPELDHELGETVLEVKSLSTASGLADINLKVAAGEIVGLAGLVGAGKSRVGRAIFGLEDLTGGIVELNGHPLKDLRPKAQIERGVLYFPADRHREGLVLCRSVKENQTLPSLKLFERFGILNRSNEGATARELAQTMNIRPFNVDATVTNLSGGNQQKVILSRGLTRPVKVFIFDEASCGIDVGAKAEVYRFIKAQAEAGAAVIMISSELPEVLNMSHRIVVMHGGRICREFSWEEASEEKVLAACFGYEDMSACGVSKGAIRG